MTPTRFLLACLIAFLIGLIPARASEPAKAVPEYTMKAVYLYNFAQLTTWPRKPEDRNDSFKLCIYGQSELDSALTALGGRTVDRQPIHLMRVRDAKEIEQCHMLYIGDYQVERAASLLEALRGLPLLIVTDVPSLGRSGAMVLIVTEGRRLSFEVNIDSAHRAQLKFSSKLLSLAGRVNGG